MIGCFLLVMEAKVLKLSVFTRQGGRGAALTMVGYELGLELPTRGGRPGRAATKPGGGRRMLICFPKAQPPG